MKEFLLALCAILAVATARVVINAEIQETPLVLGAKACTWGPSYWCHNISTAAGCKATKHCISNIWEKMEVPEDSDSVCKICKDMVQQARDQLESDQTQQDLKAVFEGSCALIHVKSIVKECDKLVDQFIPELVETLASQMNPSVVCSVAGLCNSAHIDELLLDYQRTVAENGGAMPITLENDELKPDECSKCYTIATHMGHMLEDTSKDKLVERMLNVCGEMSSFSDACSSIILSYFDTIYSHLQENFNAKNICHLSGQCSALYHKHEDENKDLEVEIRPLSSVGMVEVSDDLPCKLCEQLVVHLRDLLVANTTETEFKQVLEGLCKQTKSFADECKSIVDEYYPVIYEYLTANLNGNAVCEMAGICPMPGKTVSNGPIWRLLPKKSAEIGIRVMNPKKVNDESQQIPKVTEADEMQLPIERLVPFHLSLPNMDVKGKETCALCEYFLHYVQQAITNPTTEEEMKQVFKKVCNKLPKSIDQNCDEFVDVYGDALVAILAQEIAPSQVCPMMHVCPSQDAMDVWEQIPKDLMIKTEVEDKPSCPLCLFAVSQLYNTIKENKTEASIEAALNKLCNHLPKDLVDQCDQLVRIYSKELVEMLLADLTPQEVCVYLKLCNPATNAGPTNLYFPLDKDGEIMTNEIPDFPLNPIQHESAVTDTECVICEFVMQYVEKALRNKKTQEEIESVVHGVCNHLPKTVSQECNDFVKEYAELIISLVSQDISPREICSIIGLCQPNLKQIEESISECALCQTITSKIDKLLDDSTVDSDIEETVSKVCKYLPGSKQAKCTMMMEIYEQSIINLLKSHGDPKKICSKLALCSTRDYLAMKENSRTRRSDDLGAKRCTWGPMYWCSSDKTATQCKAVDHCKEHVWFAESAAEAKRLATPQPQP
ncbi:prosaposin [Orussus abietinus]|uniref:prosaposin n=1 Tax=Orussus abietinus TaxID=222816 RepID=UPI00062586B4|nr:prosaposin [Orussus abietinus]